MTKTAKTKADLTALLRARCTLFVISTREEVRVERATIEAASDAGYETWFWDCATGVTDGEGKAKFAEMQDPNALMKKIRDDKQRRVYVCRDLHKWLDPIVTRNVRSLARTLQGAPRSEARAIVLIQPSSEIPPELAGSAVVIDWPLPERSEIATLLDDVLGALPKEFAEKALADGTRDAAIDAAVGLTAEEAATCFSRSLVTTRTVDPQVVAAEKKRVVEREGVLSWYDPDPRGLDAVGGLDTLKSWLRTRRSALSQRARQFGLPAPKGCMLVGIPGCIAEGARLLYKRGQRKSAGGRALSIETFYEKFNGLGSHACQRWADGVPTYLQSWDAASGRVIYNEVQAVVDSGVKECVCLVTDTAGQVELTADHPVLTAGGEFLSAGSLRFGDRLLARGSMMPCSTGKKRVYRKRAIIEGLKHHPVAWVKVVDDGHKRYQYGRITKARLVVEAHMNKLDYDEFVRILKEEPETAELLAFLPAAYDVHHIDEDPTNDSLDNLMVTTHEGHARLHGAFENFHVAYTVEATVISVESVGCRRTFDIAMAIPQTNFVLEGGIIVHNCGKSLSAKAVAGAWGLPLLRLDLGSLRSKYVGDSEANVRKALKVAEAVSPCVLWLDEIEKSFAGSSGPQGDGGVAADALGAVLSWMQERSGSVFVVATANDVSNLPPELLRKGRFDELFFVDLPSPRERAEVLAATIRQHGRDPETIELEIVAEATDGFSGAEVAALVPDALFVAV